jgi:hypothetical protein
MYQKMLNVYISFPQMMLFGETVFTHVCVLITFANNLFILRKMGEIVINK